MAEHRIDLEERLVFQERALEQLNRVVAEQQLEIDDLVRDVKELRRLAAKSGAQEAPGTDQAGGRNLEDDRPPHY